ncbi:hypothetical protein CMV_010693 [Castanea mollissima]|uniref:SWIRM domain-containing protein n=1 Tax=Castanea mollissima TaxID=60419 RepID=A0A8J4R539_9ROSI|nr:hypothetical protein CMV_010693 [Castanea mollissima]
MIKETEHKSYLGTVHYSLNRTHAWIIYIVFTFQDLRDKVDVWDSSVFAVCLEKCLVVSLGLGYPTHLCPFVCACLPNLANQGPFTILLAPPYSLHHPSRSSSHRELGSLKTLVVYVVMARATDLYPQRVNLFYTTHISLHLSFSLYSLRLSPVSHPSHQDLISDSSIKISSASSAGAAVGRGGFGAEKTKELALAAQAEAMERRKEIELEALEASMEAEFEAIRSRGTNAHVIPSHCGWFSWTKVHPIEERMMPSFFIEKSETRTPDMYLEIRNWILKKFHSNPSTQIELKDLSELEVGDSDARQEMMEFLDYWGLINFQSDNSSYAFWAFSRVCNCRRVGKG